MTELAKVSVFLYTAEFSLQPELTPKRSRQRVTLKTFFPAGLQLTTAYCCSKRYIVVPT